MTTTSRQRAFLAIGLFAGALAWRLAWQARLAHSAFAGSLDADSRVYWAWSEFILRHGPIPPAPFFLAPLYPYALAVWRALGAGMDQVLAIQAILGAATVVLLADATARLAGTRVALAVGVLLALFQPAVFFEALLLPESLLLFFESLLTWWAIRGDWSRARLRRFTAAGALVGVLALGRASDVLLAWMLIPLALRAPAGGRLRRLGVAAAACVLCIAPATLANLHASGEWIPLTYNLGFNLSVGNHAGADGAWHDITRGSLPVPLPGTSPVTGGAIDGRAFLLATTGRRLTPAQSSAEWSARAARFARDHPGRALALTGRKLLLLVGAGEVAQIERMASFARAAGPLGLPFLGSYGCLAALGLAGLAFAPRAGPAGRWVMGALGLGILGLLPFFVTDRYRIHLVPELAVLSGLGIAELARARGGVSSWRPLFALAVAAALVWLPLRRTTSRGEDWTFDVDRGMRLLDRDPAGAVEAFGRAAPAIEVADPASLAPDARIDLAAFELRYGIALESLGREAEAIAHWERAAVLNPRDATSLGRLSIAYADAGRSADAARIRARLAGIPGGPAQLLVEDGWDAAARGDAALAEQRFVAATREAPDLPIAWEGLIRVRIQTGRDAEAAMALVEARGSGLVGQPAEIYEAYLAARRGDLEATRRALAAAGRWGTPRDPVLARLRDDAAQRAAAVR